jgi:glycosyltransferase involved in cell wall biosynthesis
VVKFHAEREILPRHAGGGAANMTQPAMKSEQKKSLTVFIPALNEQKTLEPTVTTVLRALALEIDDFEVLVVNDGSTDRTPEIADRLARQHPQVRALHHPARMGVGRAYVQAVDAASKRCFVFIPGDDSWPFESVRELFRNLGKADVVVSYATNPAARRGGIPRIMVSSGFTAVLNLLHGLDLKYYNGLAIYPIQFLREKPIRTYGFGFAAEALLHAIYKGMSYVEVGLQIQELNGGISKAVTLRNILSVIGSIVRCFWQLRVRRLYGQRESRPERAPS